MTVETTKPIVTFRDRMREVWSPPWLATGNAERFLYAFGLMADIFADALVAGVASRFPGVYGFESLPAIGRERRITRGLAETDLAYAARLRRWLEDHKRRGGPYALLSQLYAYYGPNNFPITLLYRSGRRFDMAADGTVTRSIDTRFAPDTNPAQWARWWLFFALPQDALDGLTDDQRASMQHVPREWNAAHCTGTLIATEPTGELWNWPLGRKWNEPGKWNTTGRTLRLPVD